MTSTTNHALAPDVTFAAGEVFARQRLRFLLIDPADPLPGGDVRGYDPTVRTAGGDRFAMALVDEQGQAAARVDLAVAGPIGRWSVLVRADRRGRRLGSRLADVALRHARLLGVRCLHADIVPGDERALHVLRRRGPVHTAAATPASRTMCLQVVVGGGCRRG